MPRLTKLASCSFNCENKTVTIDAHILLGYEPYMMTKASHPRRRSRGQYASLEPRLKILKEATIRKRWKKLPVGTQARVADLLRTVERPALTHESSERRNIDAQTIVSELVEEYASLQVPPHLS